MGKRKMTLGDLAEDLGLGYAVPLVCKLAPGGTSVQGCSKVPKNTIVRGKKGYVTLLAYTKSNRKGNAAAISPFKRVKGVKGKIATTAKGDARRNRRNATVRAGVTTAFAKAARRRGGNSALGRAAKACKGMGKGVAAFRACVKREMGK